MHFTEGIRAAVDMFRQQRRRALIIVLCTAMGVSFLVGVVAVVDAVGRYVELDLLGKLYGFNTIQVSRGAGPSTTASASEVRARSRRRPLSFDDAAWLAARVPATGVIAFNVNGRAKVGVSGRRVSRERVLGASATQFSVQRLDVRRGRPFAEHEAASGAAVAVLGSELAQRLFGNRDPIGTSIRIEGIAFRVVGVLERRGSFFGFSMDRLVVVPARSPLNGIINGYNEADALSFRVDDAGMLDAASAAIEGEMRVRHHLRPDEDNDFDLTTSKSLMDGWRRVQRLLLVAGPSLTGVALLVTILVAMNVMLVVVTERVPEIGLRKALGARRRDILMQFLTESMALASLGGALGVILGSALADIVAMASPLPARLAPWSAVLGVATGAIVGLLAGVYPAWRAAELTPIEALRRE
jgi:putative ABC transport system permease protein